MRYGSGNSANKFQGSGVGNLSFMVNLNFSHFYLEPDPILIP